MPANLRVYIKLLLMALFWGGTFPAGRIVAQEVAPFSAAFLRFLIALACLIPLTRRFENGLPRIDRRRVLLTFCSGFTGAVLFNVFFFMGIKIVTAGRASVIIATNPIFIFIFSIWLFQERIDPLKVVGFVFSFVGAAWVITRGHPLAALQGGVGWGELFLLGSMASWVIYSLIGKVIIRSLAPMAAATYACLFGNLVLVIPAFLEPNNFLTVGYSLQAWLALVYLAVFGSAMPLAWFYQGIKAIGPARAATFINFVPVSGVFTSWLLLNETLDLSLIIGAILVVGGICLINRPTGD